MGAPRARPTDERCRNNITDGERDFPVSDRFWLALLSPPGTTALTRAATDGRAMSGSDDEMRDAEVKADAKPKAEGQPMDADSDSDDDGTGLTDAEFLAAIARPTALEMPAPRGPVVTSTPGVSNVSGWPGVFEPH